MKKGYIFDLGRVIVNFDLDIALTKFLEIWGSVFSENMAFMEVLEKVKNSPKVILSNIDPLHWNIIKEFKIVKDYFEDKNCIRSYNVGIRKPDEKIYNLAIGLLGDVNEIIYIDDVSEYIAFAKTIGITAINYDCRFDSISELIKKV